MIQSIHRDWCWVCVFSCTLICVAACNSSPSHNRERSPLPDTSANGSISTPASAAPTAVPIAALVDAAAVSASPPQTTVPAEPGAVRFVVTHSHELKRSEKTGLALIRATLQRPSKLALKVNVDPATDDERRYIDQYLAAIEQPDRTVVPLPPSWLHYEAVIAIPIHAPMTFASEEMVAGYRDLLIFRPPAQEAAYASHYTSPDVFGPRGAEDIGKWLMKHLQLQAQEGAR